MFLRHLVTERVCGGRWVLFEMLFVGDVLLHRLTTAYQQPPMITRVLQSRSQVVAARPASKYPKHSEH